MVLASQPKIPLQPTYTHMSLKRLVLPVCAYDRGGRVTTPLQQQEYQQRVPHCSAGNHSMPTAGRACLSPVAAAAVPPCCQAHCHVCLHPPRPPLQPHMLPTGAPRWVWCITAVAAHPSGSHHTNMHPGAMPSLTFAPVPCVVRCLAVHANPCGDWTWDLLQHMFQLRSTMGCVLFVSGCRCLQARALPRMGPQTPVVRRLLYDCSYCSQTGYTAAPQPACHLPPGRTPSSCAVDTAPTPVTGRHQPEHGRHSSELPQR
jgi:hypothetical protein